MQNLRRRRNSIINLFALFALLFAQIGIDPPQTVSAKPLSAPTPSVLINLPASIMLGQTLNFSLSFSNAQATGYGPYVDLYLPLSGIDGQTAPAANDGISFISANYLTQSVASTTQTCTPGNTFVHPLTRQTVTCPAAPSGAAAPFTWQLTILTLPFGSFVTSQPPVTLDISTSLSSLADLGVNLPVMAVSGFMFGADALDNPAGDPPIIGSTDTANVKPTVMTLTKTYEGPELETATGINYKRQYTINVDIAENQTINNLVITDTLPGNNQYTQIISTTSVGPDTTGTCTPPSTSTPGGTLSCAFTSVKGTSGTSDITIVYEYYVPYLDAGSSIILETCGNPQISNNNVTALGNWVPLDTRDSGTDGNAQAGSAGAPPEAYFTAKSIATQKSVSVVGGGDPMPGKVLDYAIQFQVSDYYALDQIVLNDTISDGQRVDTTFAPTLQVNGNGFILPAQDISNANVIVTPNYTPVSTAPNDGTTVLTFNVSDEIAASVSGSNGRLVGGCILPAGGLDPNCSTNDSATTGVIHFRTIIQENFSDTFPSGDPSVDQGDILKNSVTIQGRPLSQSDFSTLACSNQQDGSNAGITISHGKLVKSIFAVDGNKSFSTPVEVTPGSLITYRLLYTLPTGDVENFHLVDFLPLPIFEATLLNTTFESTTPTGNLPSAWHASLGPSDTFYNYYHTYISPSNNNPTISIDGGANAITFNYGDFNGPDNDLSTRHSYTVDILFTVVVNNNPFADRLFLTNQAEAHEGATNGDPSKATSIIQIILTEPAIPTLQKGVVWSDNSGGLLSPTPVGPVSFDGAAMDCSSRLGGIINSDGIATNPISSDISNLDAGDTVMFALAVENKGTGLNGAFDVQVGDTLPAGISYVSNSLCVTDGTGAAISYTPINAGGSLFNGGIQLDDPGPTNPPAGALDGYHATSGRNIGVITYLAKLDTAVTPNTTLSNQAQVLRFSNIESGINFLASPLTSSASVQTKSPTIAKTITGTGQTFTNNYDLAVGETISYEVTMTVPEGTIPNAQLVDTLDAGLAFVQCDSVTSSPAGAITGGNLSCAAASFSASPSGSATPENQGRVMTLNFGDIVNSNIDNTSPETITVRYTAIALNSTNTVRGAKRNNAASLQWTGGSSSASAPDATIVEPGLKLTKTASPTSGDAGDTITFTLVVNNAGGSNAPAYDVVLSDIIPANMTYVDNSLTAAAGLAPTTLTQTGAGAPSARWDTFTTTDTSTLTFNAVLGNNVFPGASVINSATVKWTSLPSTAVVPSAQNTLACERTGNTADCGTTSNTYTQNSTAAVSITGTPVKSLVQTSESATTVGSKLAIGEIARYHLVMPWPEGQSTAVSFVDSLPTGMQFMNDNTTKVAFVSNNNLACPNSANTLTSSTLGSSPWLCGNASAITPTYGLPSANISVSGNNVTFQLGDITNADRDADSEYIVIEFNALLLNSGNNPGDTRTNKFNVIINGGSPITSNNDSITVSRPSLTVTKTVVAPLPKDAKDPVTYTITVTNGSGANVSTAYDIDVLDNLNTSYLENLNVAGMVITVPAYATPTNKSDAAANKVEVVISELRAGASATITFTANVKDGVLAGQIIPNSVTAAYSSLPGANGTASNPTGSTTPGAPGTPTGEWTGSASGSGPVTLIAPAIDKLAVTPDKYAIGSQITYTINVTLPEGTTQALVVNDVLPTGLKYISHTVNSAGFSPALPASTPTLPTGASGGTLSLNFGNVSNTADNNTSNDTFSITVVAQVTNESSNQNNITRTNTASLTYTKPDSSSATINDPTPVTVTIIEPELRIVKNADILTPAFGQTVTYTLTISHLGTSTAPAYNINIQDTLPTGVTYVANSAVVPSGWTAAFSGSLLTVTGPSLSQGNTAIVTYQATVGYPPTVTLRSTLVNTPNLTWTSLASQVNSVWRDGTGGTNDYKTTASRTITVTGPDLSITKTDGKTTYTPGTNNTYTITVTNTGNGSVTGATVTDTRPTGVSAWSWTCGASTGGATGCAAVSSNPDTVTQTLTLPAGSSQVFNVTVTTPSNMAFVTGNLVNTVTAAVPAGYTEPTPENNTATDTDTPAPSADLSVTKTDGVSTYTPGLSLTYTVTLTNLGPSDAPGSSITDNKPAQIATWDWACTAQSSGAAGCTDMASSSANFSDTVDLPLGGTITYTVTAQINPAATGNLANTATVATPSGITDPISANNTATDNDSVTVVADLSITKDDGVLKYIPGESVTYTITVSNTSGPSSITGAVVSDTRPSQVSSWTWTCGTATGGANGCDGVTDSTANFTDTINLPLGSSQTYSVTAKLRSNSVGDLVNTATITLPGGATDPTPENNTATDTDNADPQTDLSVTKDDGVDTYIPGDSLTYTIVVKNDGPSDANGLIVSDPIPSQISVWTWVCAPHTVTGCVDVAANSADFTQTLVLPGHTTVTYTVTANLNPGYITTTDSLTNTVTITPPAGVTELTPDNHVASDTDSVDPQVNLTVTKDDGSTAYVPGVPLTYTITTTNQGPSDVYGAVLTDIKPSIFSTWAWICNTTAISGCLDVSDSSANFTQTLNIPAGATVSYTVTAKTLSSATGNLSNTASISAPSGVTETHNEDNSATDSDNPGLQADLSITKNDNSLLYIPGGNLTYTVTVANDGPSDAIGATVTDSKPVQISKWSWTCAGSTGAAYGCDEAADSSSDFSDMVNLPAGSSITYSVDVVIDPAAAGNLANTAVIAAPTGVLDTDSTNNSATDTDTPDPQVDLTIAKDNGVSQYVPGSSVTYTITVRNDGPSNVIGAVLTDTIPVQVSSWAWVCGSSTGGAANCDGAASNSVDFTDTLDLPVNSSQVYTVTANLHSDATGDLVNTAVIAAPAGVTETDDTNNTSTDTDTIDVQVDLTITKDDGVSEYIPGTSLTYTITVQNSGPSDAVGAAISDALPPQISSWTWVCGTPTGGASGCDGITNGTTAFSDLVNLPAGGSLTYTVTAILKSGGTGDLVNQVSVQTPSGATDTNPVDNTAEDTDTVHPKVDLSITKTDGNTLYTPGHSVVYTITVNNSGPSDAIDTVLSDSIPTQVTAWSWVCTAQNGGASGCDGVTGSSSDFTDIITIPTAGSIVYTVTADVSRTATGDLINTAEIQPADGTEDTDPSTNTDTDNDGISIPDLSIVKIADVASTTPGSQITYTLTYANNGINEATGVVLQETVPENTTFQPGHNTPDWVCTPDNTAGSACQLVLGTLPANSGEQTAAFVVIVDANLPSGVENIDNTVQIGDDGGNGVDPTPSDNTSSTATPVDAAPDITITKTDHVIQVAPGAALTYTLTIANEGNQDATGVVITDTLPQGLQFVSASDGGAYDPTTRVVTWDAISLSAQASVTRTVQVTVDNPLVINGDQLTNTAHAEDDGANGTDPNNENNDASDTDFLANSGKNLIDPVPQGNGAPKVTIGQIITYEVRLMIAPGDVENLVLTDILDSGLAFLDCEVIPDDFLSTSPIAMDQICSQARTISAPNGSIDPVDAGRQMVINFGTITNRNEIPVMLTVHYRVVVLDVKNNVNGIQLKNTAAWTWTGGSLPMQAGPVIITEPLLQLAKTVDVQNVRPGTVVTYTLTLTHKPESKADAQDVDVKDTLPPELTYIPGSLKSVSGQKPTSLIDSGTPTLVIHWNNFANDGQNAVISFQATVGHLPDGVKITNTASAIWSSLPGNFQLPQTPNNNYSNERFYLPNSQVDTYGANDSVTIGIPKVALPLTGFAPDQVTTIPQQPAESIYQLMDGITLQIPSLGVNIPVVGVPLENQGWDVTWLGNQAGWLAGTAFPGWNGNTALTAHVYDANGKPGPFVNLANLKWGDEIIVRVNGTVNHYQVQQVQQVSPQDTTPLQHETRPVLTLLTCKGYNETTNSYASRIAVRAALVKTE